MENQTNDTKALENVMHENILFVCTSIDQETTNKMTTKLIEWVSKLAPTNPEISAKNTSTIISPYDEWPKDQPVLNVYLQTPGGSIPVAQSILSLLNMARAKGTIIKTINLSHASSCGSLLSVSGTKGYRYMAEDAYNLIHYGSRSGIVERDGESKYMQERADRFTNMLKNIYLENTNLTLKEINTYFKVEGSGRLYAKTCLEKGICDWVITKDGKYVNDPKLLKDIKHLKDLSR